MERNIEQLIDECVSAVRSGRVSLQECLAQHPEEREELGPLLTIALRIAPMMKPDPERKAQARNRFLDELEKHTYHPRSMGQSWDFYMSLDGAASIGHRGGDY